MASERFPIFVTTEQARTIERALLRETALYTQKIMEYSDGAAPSMLIKMREMARRAAQAIHE